jgi:hypothetical protein
MEGGLMTTTELIAALEPVAKELDSLEQRMNPEEGSDIERYMILAGHYAVVQLEIIARDSAEITRLRRERDELQEIIDGLSIKV